MAEVEALAQTLDPGDFAQFLAKLALYKRGDPAPLARRGPRRLRAAGRPRPRSTRWWRSPPTATAARLARAFRGLGARAAARPALDHRRRPLLPRPARRRRRRRRPGRGARPRPPAGLRRRAGRAWPRRRARSAPAELEKALALIIEAELALRSSRPLPGPALVERLLRPDRHAATRRLTTPSEWLGRAARDRFRPNRMAAFWPLSIRFQPAEVAEKSARISSGPGRTGRKLACAAVQRIYCGATRAGESGDACHSDLVRGRRAAAAAPGAAGRRLARGADLGRARPAARGRAARRSEASAAPAPAR